MIDDNIESCWLQHFPTYSFKDRDIALEEYKTAAKNLEAEERVFLNASNIAVIAVTGFGSLVIGSLDKLTKQFETIIPGNLILSLLLVLIAGFSLVTLRYFADRQKAVVFSARKVIVLRRMLGLSYGTMQLVLPNWRIEGADEPFAVRLFSGWTTYVAYPFYTLAGISAALIFILMSVLLKGYWAAILCGNTPTWGIPLALSCIWWLFLAFKYRQALLDVHERSFLLAIQIFARFIYLKLITNFEYVIYRATLARYEIIRLQVDLTNLKKMLIFIEDRSFYSHYGLSIRAITRALLGLLRFRRRSGGSTITQQLVRTLFIQEISKLTRRKVVEMLLAICFDRIFTKNEQLELYLASVRFERGVFGVLEAMHYFWGRKVTNPTTAEAFFLIERVSNIHSNLLCEKIIQTVKSAINMGAMTAYDAGELYKLYYNAVAAGKIKDFDCKIDLMAKSFAIV